MWDPRTVREKEDDWVEAESRTHRGTTCGHTPTREPTILQC